MANSKIEIEFQGVEGVPVLGDIISIGESVMGLTMIETFKDVRAASYQTRIPSSYTDPDPPHLPVYTGYTSYNYRTAFNLDYNFSNIFTVSATAGESGSGLGKVTITANYPNAVFSVIQNTTSAIITVTNTISVPDFTIDEVAISSGGSPCQDVQVQVTTNNLAVNILQPYPQSGNTANPIVFDWPRGQVFNLKLQDGSGTFATQQITTPPLLNAANFSLNINNTPYGATVTITKSNSEGLDIEYSLDNSTWQSSNVYSGIAEDSYTLYIRDQYGCSTSVNFAVTAFGTYSPFFYISKSNAIRYALREDFTLPGVYKNDENTLSHEVDVKLLYREIQQFLDTDIIPTQFKSNYATNSASVINKDGSIVSIPVVQKTANIGCTDRRDAMQFDAGNGRTGIYFQSGNIYDFNTSAIIEPYALYGGIPLWGKVGNYVIIGTAWYKIEEIIFDELRNSEAIVFTGIYTGADAPVIVGSIFNLQQYEIYEYSIPMTSFNTQRFSVKLEARDPNFPDIDYLSEEIDSSAVQDNTVEIRYRNSTNTDVFYSTGIEYLIRPQIIKKGGLEDQTQDTYKTDTNVYLTSGDVYEGDEIIFDPVTKAIMQLIVRALSHEEVFIDGVGYVKSDSVDIDGPLEDSNLYAIKAKMLKNGNVYNSKTSGSTVISGNMNVPGLLSFGGGLIRY